jgi:hypothetical protein
VELITNVLKVDPESLDDRVQRYQEGRLLAASSGFDDRPYHLSWIQIRPFADSAAAATGRIAGANSWPRRCGHCAVMEAMKATFEDWTERVSSFRRDTPSAAKGRCTPTIVTVYAHLRFPQIYFF